MKKKELLLVVLLLVRVASSFVARADTLLMKSPSMNRDIRVIIVTPDTASGKKATARPTVYLLHDLGGHAKMWIGIKPNLPQITDGKGIIFVYPGRSTSWYWDNPKGPPFRYETSVSSELVEYVDGHYKTITDRKGRAITSLSIGGHGGLWTAIRHKDTFGVCGSTSGGVDIRPFLRNQDIVKHLGNYESNKEIWDTHTVINQIDKTRNGDLAIIFDCGEANFLIQVNKGLHNRLLEKKIDHDFITRSGGHTGEYWNNAIDYQISFFNKLFRK